MKLIVQFAVIMFCCTNMFAQTTPSTKPQFPGGEKALAEFLTNSIKYPEEAQKQKWEGKSLIAFTVNEDGSLSNIRVLKSSWLILDNEALRIVKMMPKWTPATENGVNKKEMVVLPIQFDLSRKDILYK